MANQIKSFRGKGGGSGGREGDPFPKGSLPSPQQLSPLPVIFVLLDGLSQDAAACMGCLNALAEDGQAVCGSMDCELPALSRPLYHCILTGLTPAQSGILHNEIWRPHPAPTIFALAHQAGLRTAAAAYSWMSELCNGTPFEPWRDRYTDDASLPISHGLFYSNDAYPDDHVFMDAEALRRRYAPQLLLVHSMGIDDAGHHAGGDSAAYRKAARRADMLLARYVPLWLADGARVIVTSDHGMHADGMHNGETPAERRVPFWLLGEGMTEGITPERQPQWFGILRGLLGL